MRIVSTARACPPLLSSRRRGCPGAQHQKTRRVLVDRAAGRGGDRYGRVGPSVSAATQAQFYGELASARLIDREMANGERSGYRFSLNGGEGGYTIHADPLKKGQSGRLHFYSDDTLTVRQSQGPEQASADSPPL